MQKYCWMNCMDPPLHLVCQLSLEEVMIFFSMDEATTKSSDLKKPLRVDLSRTKMFSQKKIDAVNQHSNLKASNDKSCQRGHKEDRLNN